jgi:hypothetical protein
MVDRLFWKDEMWCVYRESRGLLLPTSTLIITLIPILTAESRQCASGAACKQWKGLCKQSRLCFLI